MQWRLDMQDEFSADAWRRLRTLAWAALAHATLLVLFAAAGATLVSAV
jgi:hypothetical protein